MVKPKAPQPRQCRRAACRGFSKTVGEGNLKRGALKPNNNNPYVRLILLH